MDFTLPDPYPELNDHNRMKLTIPTAEGPIIYFSDDHETMISIILRLIDHLHESLDIVTQDQKNFINR